ncbi:hypothetical protein [Sphingopyxis sp.]|nr:hypothetical protein [Sphingopyxis sp.]MCW0197789.1 hypothetical protein [Sphingopyxis sp.]
MAKKNAIFGRVCVSFFVMPDLIRHPAFAAVISGTADQVRGDEEMMARLL